MPALRLFAASVALFFLAPDSAGAKNGYGAVANCASPSPTRAECTFPPVPSRRVLIVKKLAFHCVCPSCDTMIGGALANLTFTPEIGNSTLTVPVAASFAQGQSTPYPITGNATEADGISVRAASTMSLAITALSGSNVTLSSCKAWVTGVLTP